MFSFLLLYSTEEIFQMRFLDLALGIQIAQCRYYLQTLGPNVGIICILGSLDLGLRGAQLIQEQERHPVSLKTAVANSFEAHVGLNSCITLYLHNL